MPCWFYEKEALSRTPSIKSGLTLQQERTFRKEGASFILDLGNYLKLTSTTCATACTYFHRFYMFQSFNDYPRFLMATACLFLAGKVEETPKKWKVVLKAAMELLKEDQLSGFEGFDSKLLLYERILLQTIQFDLIVEHPYQYILKYVKNLKGEKSKIQNLVQMAWTFANDGLRTTLSLEWEPSIIAIAFLCLAGKFNDVNINEMQGKKSGNWWDNIFDDLTNDLIEDICHQVLDLYGDTESENKLKRDAKKKPSKVSPNSIKSSPRTPHSEAGDAPPESKKSRKSSRPSSRLESPHVSTSSKSGAVSQHSVPPTNVSQMAGMPPGTMILAGAPGTTNAQGQQAVIIHAAPQAMYAYQHMQPNSTTNHGSPVLGNQPIVYTFAAAPATGQQNHAAYLQPVATTSSTSGATLIYPQSYIQHAGASPNVGSQVYTATPAVAPVAASQQYSGSQHRGNSSSHHQSQHSNYSPSVDQNSSVSHRNQSFQVLAQPGLQQNSHYSHSSHHQQQQQHGNYQNSPMSGAAANSTNNQVYYQQQQQQHRGPQHHNHQQHQHNSALPPPLQAAPGANNHQQNHSAFHQTHNGRATGISNWQPPAAASTGWMK